MTDGEKSMRENIPIPSEISKLKDDLGKVNWNDKDSYKKGLEYIVSVAREITEAEIGVLFLTSDDIFLEAAHWSKEEGDVPPASELPTYRLNWWEENDELLDGITAYVAIRQETVNLNQNEVFTHHAWKGKWDAVFLGGERTRCKGILAVPIISEINKRVYGVLKVENPGEPTSYCRFTPEQEKNLKVLSCELAKILDTAQVFWRNFVEVRADLKVSYIVELLERGRPTSYNLSQSLNYINSLFLKWLGSDDAVHVFWRSGKPPKCHVLSSWNRWDEIKGLELTQHISLDEKDLDKKNNLSKELVTWIEGIIGPKIVQPGLRIDDALWKVLFPKLDASKENYVDVIRLKAGKFDIGAVLLPQSGLLKDDGSKENKEEISRRLETLTRLAMNVVSILGRFIEDEYETTRDTYLPLHRPPRLQKTCAILFADIRNFSSLVQILRLMGKTKELEPFMDQFCAKMGKVISETPFGRVDKFLGDGVMAFFGEYLDDSENTESEKFHINDQNIKKVILAVVCACKMLKEFRELHKEWIEKGLCYTNKPRVPWSKYEPQESISERKPLIDYRKQFNEDVQIDLTIGINIGEIYFDYFGDRIHREYTAIGDHVNFAQRIRGVAGEYDESIHRMRSNILLSQTAYHLLCDSGCLLGEKVPFWPRFKGFGFAYPIYELECTDLNYAKIVEIMADMNRKKYEKEDEKQVTCLQCTPRN